MYMSNGDFTISNIAIAQIKMRFFLNPILSFVIEYRVQGAKYDLFLLSTTTIILQNHLAC